MLQLKNPTTVFLNNAQTRIEKHGDDDVLAVDLAVTWNTNNRALAAIHPQLREALFYLRDDVSSDDGQGEMDLPVDDLPNVRLPGADYPIKLDHQQIGARVMVAYGIDDESGVILSLCKVHKFKVTPVDGGVAEVKFAISSSADIDEHIAGRLSVLQQRDITITLTMPDVDQAEPKADPGSDPAWPFPNEPKTPEQAFIDTEET